MFMKRLLFPFFLVFISIACNNKTQTGTSGDANFQQLADDYLEGHLAWRPQVAVGLGLHQYDGKITDFSKESLDAELKRLKNYDQQLSAIDTSSLNAKMFRDYRILRSAIRAEIYNFEDVKVYQHNPMTYANVVDVNIYIKRDYAPLEQR